MNKKAKIVLYVFYGVAALIIIGLGLYFYNSRYSFNLVENDISMLLGDKYNLQISASSGNFNVNDYTFKLSNDNLTLDGITLSANKEGNTVLTIKSKKGFNERKVTVNVINEKANSIVADENITVEVDEHKQVKSVINNNEKINSNLKYESLNPNVATVDDSGKVTGVSNGTATIKITYSDDVYTYSQVEVVSEKIELDNIEVPSEIKMLTGETKEINMVFVPSNATDKTVSITSSDTSIVKVVNNSVVGLKAGNATVTITSGKVKKNIKVVVTDPTKNNNTQTPVVAESYTMTFTINKSQISTSDTAKLTCYITSNIGLYEECKDYSISNQNLVSISNGIVKGLKPGTVTITASKYGQSKSVTLKITEAVINPSGILLNKSNLTLSIGQSDTIAATVLPSNAINRSVTWSSSNSNIATVSNGTVTAKSAGTVTITATTSNGHKAQATVVVNKKVVDLIRGSIYNNGFLHFYAGKDGNVDYTEYEYNNRLVNNCGNRNSVGSQYFTLYPANNQPLFQECHMEGDTKVYTATVNGNNDKLVKVTPNDEVQLDIVTYGKSYSPYGNTWPHLLITGRVGTNGLGVPAYFNGRLSDGMTGLTEADRSYFYFTNDNKINLSLDVKLNSYNKGNPINGVQAFQYLLFLEVYCDSACGNGQVSYWFGFNLFDDRGACYEANQGDVRVDEKTQRLTVLLPSKGIYTNGTIYNDGNFAYDWKHVDIDVSKRINELVHQIHLSGKSNVKASDLRYGGFNIGYEVHGEYWTSMSFKNLSLTSTKK